MARASQTENAPCHRLIAVLPRPRRYRVFRGVERPVPALAAPLAGVFALLFDFAPVLPDAGFFTGFDGGFVAGFGVDFAPGFAPDLDAGFAVGFAVGLTAGFAFGLDVAAPRPVTVPIRPVVFDNLDVADDFGVAFDVALAAGLAVDFDATFGGVFVAAVLAAGLLAGFAAPLPA